jgi:hypothetical protein
LQKRYVVPYRTAQVLKATLRPGGPKDLSIDEEIGFLLLAEFLHMVRDFHGAYLKDG